ncbi:MAG: tetratricopeptide repeat protein [Planctomycetes bacterium]|nr:tetratricopeptide repeat protein [Planctomycetota bacterium]
MDDATFLEDDPLVDEGPLHGKRVALVGKLGGVNRREAQQLVRGEGGVMVDRSDEEADLVVIGAEEFPLADLDALLAPALRAAAAEGRVEIITETELWQRLGLVENEQHVRRLYTPAMLADLLNVPVAIIRRWHRRGLIAPAREVKRLPYFDFQEVATARRLAQVLAEGVSPAALERKLAELARFTPGAERPLAQLQVIVEGRELLLRRGEGLIEPGGQLRWDFEKLENLASESGRATPEDAVVEQDDLATPEQLLDMAMELEDEERLDEAAEMYRAALAAGGPRADICFQLAELLYRQGDLIAARERYYMAIEMDEDYVEARANLGCVLAELGDRELAISALEGALQHHNDYPDAHYHLATLLDGEGREEAARIHWQEFLRLAPDSPWAEEARQRLHAASDEATL